MKSIWNTLYISDLLPHHSFSCDQQVKITEYAREKILNIRNTYKKKCWTHQTPKSKNFKPTKYPRENILEPRHTHEKKNLDLQNTHKKKFWTHEIPLGKNF